MKKILALLLVFCMLVPMAAFAETTEVSYAGSNATCNVYIEGEATTTFVSVILKDGNGNVGYINQVTPDSENNGKYALKFKFTGDISDYNVYVRDEVTGQDISASVKKAVATNVLYTASLDVAVDNADRAYIQQGDALNISVDIENKYGNDENVTVLVAAYGENNKLLAVKSTTVTALYDDLCATKDVDVSEFEIPQGTVKAKVFAWSDTETMIPVAPSKALVNKKVTVHLAGDSLCQTYNDDMYPRRGWGQYFEDYVAEGVEVNNAAISGRSTFSFLYVKEGTFNKGVMYKDYESSPYYKNIVSKIEPGDYVIISFAINDCYQSAYDVYANADATDRYIKSGGSYYHVEEYDDEKMTATISSTTSVLPEGYEKVYSWCSDEEAYKANLQKMIDDAIEQGATPILLGSTNTYQAKGDNLSPSDSVKTYATTYMQDVAKENNIVYINIHDYAHNIYNTWGSNQTRMHTVQLDGVSAEWFEKYGYTKPYRDYAADPDSTHYNENGARWIASLVAKLIYESDSDLKELVNEPDVYDIPVLYDEAE